MFGSYRRFCNTPRPAPRAKQPQQKDVIFKQVIIQTKAAERFHIDVNNNDESSS